MYELRIRRVFALVIGTGLIVLPLVISWLDPSFFFGLWLDPPSFLRNWFLPPLILALLPTLIGAMVRIWIRRGSYRPWLRASRFGMLIWCAFLLMIIMSAIAWAHSQLPPDHPSYSGGSGPQPGYGVALFTGFAVIYGGMYAIVGLPFILLGAAFTYQRRGERIVRTNKSE